MRLKGDEATTTAAPFKIKQKSKQLHSDNYNGYMVAAGIIGGEGSTRQGGGGGGGVYNLGTNHEEENHKKKEKARQRWKILCLVKTSDPKTDVAARQERITEKVDDWMRKMVMQMHLTDDSSDVREDKSGDAGESNEEYPGHNKTAFNRFKNLANNVLTNDYKDKTIFSSNTNQVVPKDEIQRLQNHENSNQLKKQRDRMAAREKAEWERERQLILDGKLKLKKEHLQMQDPVLKLHYDKMQMKRKASKGPRSPKPSINRKYTASSSSGNLQSGSNTSSLISGPKSAIKLRWSSAMSRVKANAILEKKTTAAKMEKLREEQEEFEEEKEKEKMMRINHRRKGGISIGPPHPLYQHLKANRLSTYYNAYDEVETYLDDTKEAHETMKDVEDATETVVAQLLYDEVKDELKSNMMDDEFNEEELEDNTNKVVEDCGDGNQRKQRESKGRMNPVYAALDDAKDVDDMFRIAEIWVNPLSYGIS